MISPFGQRVDYATKRTLDLDKSYRSIIKAAAEDAGLTCLRADEVIHSGTIDKAVFEQLLNAEVVVADLSTSDANTIYLLGVRHVLRPHTTIVIAENQFKFPFDVAHQEIVQYEHLGSGIDVEEARRMRELLATRILERLQTPKVDSPVYTFLSGRQLRTPSATPPRDGRRRAFVIMGFGKKTDYYSGRVFDLDKSYRIIRAAVEETGLECVRADDIVHSGVIDLPMYGAPGHRRPGDCRPVDFERQSDLRARYQTCAASLHDPRHRGEGIPLSVRPRASRHPACTSISVRVSMSKRPTG